MEPERKASIRQLLGDVLIEPVVVVVAVDVSVVVGTVVVEFIRAVVTGILSESVSDVKLGKISKLAE